MNLGNVFGFDSGIKGNHQDWPADLYEANLPVHGQDGWELAKYEWRDGRGRFLYVRGTEETQEVWRDQPKYLVGGAR